MTLAAFVALLALTGCGGTRECRKNTLRITVSYGGVSSADHLRITAVVDGGRTLTGTFAKPGGTSGTAEVDFGSAYPAGKSIDITVEALANGVTVATANQLFTAPASCGALSITVGGGAGDGGVNTGDIAITPAAPSVKAGSKINFTADQKVNWSVQEGDAGGTITSAGVYTAPVKIGSYHVVATSQADASKQGSVVVTVVPWVLDIVAGRPGGPGTADGVGATARFLGFGNGLAYDNGNLYVADNGANTIRKVDLTTKAVTTIAGTPTPYPGSHADGNGVDARFATPWGLAVYKNFAYVTDSGIIGGVYIRRVDLTTHDVRTIAGMIPSSPEVDSQFGIGAAFNGAAGIVSDGGGHLMMVDYNGSTLRTIDLTTPSEAQPNWSTATTKVAAGGANLSLNLPIGLAYDGTSGLAYATVSSAMEKITFGTKPGAYPTVPIGTGALVTDSSGTVTDSSVSAIAVYQGKLYYTSGNGNGIVNMVTPGSGFHSVLAGGGTGAARQADGTGAGAAFANRFSLVSDGAGKLYVGDDCCIRQINIASATVTTPFGALPTFVSTDNTGMLASFANPAYVATDGADQAWVLDGNGGQFSIRKIKLSTGETSTLPTSEALSYASNLTYDGNGHIYVAVSDADHVTWGVKTIATADGTVTTPIAPASGQGTNAFVVDGSGHIYANRNSAVIEIDLTTTPPTTTTLAGTPGTKGTTDSPARFGSLQAIAWDGAGTLYVADDASIRSIAISTGVVTTLAGVPGTKGTSDGTGNAARFLRPNALAVDGNIVYIVDDSQIRRLDASTGVVTQWVGVANSSGLQPGPLPAMVNGPRSLVSMGGGALLFVDEYAVARVH